MVDCPAILMLIINFFLMAQSYFALKRWIICIIHILILCCYYNPPPPPLSTTCVHVHPHTDILPRAHTRSRLAVMKYVHTVYSLINWGCRLRHKRLHKAIPCGYFSLFIFFTWKWTAEFLLLESPWISQCDCTNLRLICRSTAETITNRKAERVAVCFPVCAPCKERCSTVAL